MSRISREQINHIAKLARIELTEQEKEKFTKELSSILDYVEKLNKVDVSKVGERITELKNVMREDKEIKSPANSAGRRQSEVQSKLLKLVPSKKGDYIKVPKILE